MNCMICGRSFATVPSVSFDANHCVDCHVGIGDGSLVRFRISLAAILVVVAFVVTLVIRP
jgi:hypothetical protein